MRRWLGFVALALAIPLTTAASCECESLCDEPGERLEFLGELRTLEDEIGTFRGPDGPIRVRIDHNSSFLDVGTTYRVRAVAGRSVGQPWVSQVNSRCGGPCPDVTITHEDGAGINTSWWAGFNRGAPVTETMWVILTIPVITLVAVTINRIRRGADHDPFTALPDDGSWVEYEGWVDDEGDPA